MSNFPTESSVVHEQDVKVLHVSDDEFLKPVRKVVTSSLVRSVPNFRHLLVTSESSSHPVIDTLMEPSVPCDLLQLSWSLPP